MSLENGVKKCPRCHEKYLVSQKKCNFCGLIFERLNYVSNKSARKEVIKFHKKNYIMTADWPFDASKKVALLLSIFLGFTGAHNFYLGRFYKGLTMLIGFVSAIVLLLLPYQSLAYNIIWYLSFIPACSVLIFWILDSIWIFLERYKIPVSIDERLYQLKNQIIENNDKNFENTNLVKIDKKLQKNVKKSKKNKKKAEKINKK